MLLSPSILTANYGCLGGQLLEAEQGGADAIHIDVMDGAFVSSIGLGVPIVRAVRAATTLPLDVHLMVAEPDRHLEAFASAGANCLTIHVETCRHLHRIFQEIAGLGCSAGVALNPATSLNAVREILTIADRVLIMSVNPGVSGQSFIPATVDRVRRLRRTLDDVNPACDLQVDGAIDLHTIRAVAQAGATNVVVGRAVYAPDVSPRVALAALRGAVTRGAQSQTAADWPRAYRPASQESA